MVDGWSAGADGRQGVSLTYVFVKARKVKDVGEGLEMSLLMAPAQPGQKLLEIAPLGVGDAFCLRGEPVNAASSPLNPPFLQPSVP